MANITKGLARNIPYRPLWKYQEKRGADLCDCCKFKNRKRKNIASIEYGHGLTPLEYFSECILPKICILKCPPKNGCDAWQPLWEKERQILEVLRQILKAEKYRKKIVPQNQLDLWISKKNQPA